MSKYAYRLLERQNSPKSRRHDGALRLTEAAGQSCRAARTYPPTGVADESGEGGESSALLSEGAVLWDTA